MIPDPAPIPDDFCAEHALTGHTHPGVYAGDRCAEHGDQGHSHPGEYVGAGGTYELDGDQGDDLGYSPDPITCEATPAETGELAGDQGCGQSAHANHCYHATRASDLDDWDTDDDYCVHCECCCTCLACEYGPRDGMLMFPEGVEQ